MGSFEIYIHNAIVYTHKFPRPFFHSFRKDMDVVYLIFRSIYLGSFHKYDTSGVV